MEKRMNKKELLKLLKSLKLDRNEFWILSSSALVLRGIYPNAGDLDIAVTNKGLEQLKNNYNISFKENGWFQVNDKIEGVLDVVSEQSLYKPEEVEGYFVENIHEYYEYLISSDREKDKLRIPIVENYIKKCK